MNRKQKKVLGRILITAALFAAALLIPAGILGKLCLFLIPYIIIGWDVLRRAAVNIAHGQVFDENFLMALATVGAFATGSYEEGVAVMLFYQIGELFQSCAVAKSRRSIAALMDICPDYAWVEREGNLVQTDPGEVTPGDIVVASKDSFRNGSPIVKRVIATEGQSVDIDFTTGTVYVDGVALDEPYIYSPTTNPEGMVFPLVVDEGCLFVMGDNRSRSMDSRDPEIGLIDKREILGKAILLMLPGNDEGTVKRDFSRFGVIS